MKNGDKPEFHQASEYNPNSVLRGFTKREYFASMVMQGLCAHSGSRDRADVVATRAIEYADELLKQLES